MALTSIGNVLDTEKVKFDPLPFTSEQWEGICALRDDRRAMIIYTINSGLYKAAIKNAKLYANTPAENLMKELTFITITRYGIFEGMTDDELVQLVEEILKEYVKSGWIIRYETCNAIGDPKYINSFDSIHIAMGTEKCKHIKEDQFYSHWVKVLAE